MGIGSWRVRGAGAVVLLAAAAFAGDPAPVRPDFLAALDRAHALVELEKWPEAEAALRKIFVDYKDDRRVRSHLREIEDDLKVTLFRRSQPPLSGTELFGSAARKFSPSSREVELQFANTKGANWTTTESGQRYFDVRLEGSLTLEADMDYLTPDERTVAVLLCYDIEKRGGYVISPGYYREDGMSVLSAPASARRVSRDKTVDLRNLATDGPSGANYRGGIAITRSNGEIAVKVGGTAVIKARDSTFTNGYLGFLGGDARNIRVKGRIDKNGYRKIVGEHYSAKFAEWQATTWKREREIPAWAGDVPVVVPDATLFEVPSDTLPAERDRVAGAATAAADGDFDGILLAAGMARRAQPRTALYLRAAMELGTGGWKEASARLDELVAAEPKFAPARLMRGRARFGLRRIDEARADFEWVVKERPACGEAWGELAILEIFRGDLAAASAAMARATDCGAGGEQLEEVHDWVHRARRGPRFAQRFEHASEHFVVVSDHSKQVCTDTAALLEKMQTQYAAALGPAASLAAKSRVYVFSGMDGYLDYAADLDVSADSTAGVYLPMLRELVIWIPIDMTSFADTTRHEGFHQYLHRLVERAPIWFNEGWAEVMGGGGPEGLRHKERDAEFVAGFVSVADLVSMPQPAFMENAGVCYTQSRYLVDFLRKTSHPKLKPLLADYFKAISSGLSQDEANAKVFAPVMDVLETAFRASLK